MGSRGEFTGSEGGVVIVACGDIDENSIVEGAEGLGPLSTSMLSSSFFAITSPFAIPNSGPAEELVLGHSCSAGVKLMTYGPLQPLLHLLLLLLHHLQLQLIPLSAACQNLFIYK